MASLADDTVDYLKIWSSASRGHWLLACEYWMSASSYHGTGVRFDNGYESEGLADVLESVMKHQNLFVLSPNLGRQGLLQIAMPKEQESAIAAARLREAFGHLALAPAERVLA